MTSQIAVACVLALSAASAPTPSSGTVELTGEVVIEEPRARRPAAGAHVVALADRPPGRCQWDRDPKTLESEAPEAEASQVHFCRCRKTTNPEDMKPEIYAEAISDADGRYRLSVPADRAHSVMLFAELGEWAAVAQNPRQIRLGKKGTVRGQVIDREGRPVEGATVRNLQPPDRQPVVTGPDGTFAIDGIPTMYVANLVISKPGYDTVLSFDDVDSPGRKERPPVFLPRSWRFRGTVRHASGSPAADAEVTATSACGIEKTTTDSKGRFAFESLAPVLQTVSAKVGKWRAYEKVRPGESTRVLRLGKAASLSGRVLESDGAPVEGAVVALIQSRPGEGTHFVVDHLGQFRTERLLFHEEATSDSSGRFRFPILGAGEYTLLVRSLPFSGTSEPLKVTVSRRRESRVELRLLPGHRLSGVVADEKGGPCPDATVRASVSPPDFLAGEKPRLLLPVPECRVTANADGRFECAGLPAGKIALEGDCPGHVPARVAQTLPADEPVRLVVEPGGMVSGRLVDEEGKAVASARLSLWRDCYGPPRKPLDLPRVHPGMPTLPEGERAQTDGEGRFRFPIVPVGAHVLVASWGDRDEERRIVRGLDVAAGDLELELAPAVGHRIEGKIELPADPRSYSRGLATRDSCLGRVLAYPGRTRGGSPVAEAIVLVDGRFSLAVANDGGHTLELVARRHAAVEPIHARPGAGEVVIPVEARAALTGKVAADDCATGAHFTVNGQTFRLADGSFSFSGLREGIATLEVSAPGCEPFVHRVALHPGEDVALAPIRLEKSGQSSTASGAVAIPEDELEALARFGQVPRCSGQRNHGPLPRELVTEATTAEVVRFLSSSNEQVLKRAVDLLCNIHDEKAREAIFALSERYPCRQWLHWTIDHIGTGYRVRRCGRMLANAGLELDKASVDDFRSWQLDAELARRLSDGDEAARLEALVDLGAIDLARRTRAVGALAAIHSEDGLHWLFRERINGFKARLRAELPAKLNDFLYSVGGSALEATAKRAGLSRALVLARLVDRLASTEAEVLIAAATSDEELRAEIKSLALSPQAAELTGENSSALLSTAKNWRFHK